MASEGSPGEEAAPFSFVRSASDDLGESLTGSESLLSIPLTPAISISTQTTGQASLPLASDSPGSVHGGGAADVKSYSLFITHDSVFPLWY